MSIRVIKYLVYGSIATYAILLIQNATIIDAARILGLMALTYLWWQIVLGFRGTARIFTKDVASLNGIHKTLGKYGYVLLLAHFTFILASSAYSLVIVTSLDLSSEFILHVKFGSIALMLASVIWISSALLRNQISWDWWKRLHILAYGIFFFSALHSNELGTFLNSNSLVRFIWMFQIISFALIVLGRIGAWAGLGKYKYTITSIKKVAQNTHQFTMQPTHKNRALSPIKGQFVYFQYKTFTQSHPFTVSHYDLATDTLSLTIKQCGDYTSKLATYLTKGSTVYIDGPYGRFTQNINDRPAILIAGGIGITPFLSQINNKNVQHLFWGCQSLANVVYEEDLKESKLPTTIFLRNEKRKGYEHGIVDVSIMKDKLHMKLTDYNYFICGPPAMMQHISRELQKNGVSQNHIFSERFSL